MNTLEKDGVRVFARQMARELLPLEVSQVSGGWNTWTGGCSNDQCWYSFDDCGPLEGYQCT